MEPLVDTLLADTERELARIERQPAARRFERMLLLALEREQTATVAYSEKMVAARIADLPVDDATREAVRRVVLWVHRDEALHAQYLRGRLLQTRKAKPAAVILAHQIVGGVGGWVGAVSHHQKPERFSIERLVSRTAIVGARWARRIPDGLYDELTYRGFRRFCLLNVALEETAVLSYERMADLCHDPAAAETIARILDDERRHAEVFRVLAASFDDDGRLVDGLTAEHLIARIGAVSRWFLPGHLRSGVDAARERCAFGRGSAVRVERGEEGELQTTLEGAVSDAGLEKLVRESGPRVAIRAQFMLGYDRRDQSNIVHPEVLATLARLLRSWGASDVAVLESPTVYDRFFANRSVAEVADYFGFRSPHYRIVDVNADLRPVAFERGLVASSVCATWADADVRIVVAKLRGDPAEIAHLCLASLGGIAGRSDGHMYTDRMIDHRTATLMTLDLAPPDFAVVDAWAPVADGPLGVMGCRRPSSVRRIYAGADALSVDAAVLADMGFADPRASVFFREADQWFGRSSAPSEVGGEPGPLEPFRAPQRSIWFRFISATAAPMYLHFSGHGSLFVPRMDESAFPPLGRPRWGVRLVRRAAQVAFGLHPPKRRS